MGIGTEWTRFVLAGALGFVVDASVLYGALALGLDYYSGRIVSFLVAVLVTWLINRRWTFRAASVPPGVGEFLRYLGAMAIGGGVNYATYALIVATAPRAVWLPLAAVAAGSVAGLGVNFTTAKTWVFRRVAAGGRDLEAAPLASGPDPEDTGSRPRG